MKEINLTINIYDDWYYAIEAEYNIAKQTNVYFGDLDSFIKEIITSLVFSDQNYEFIDMYVERHYEYICEKIPNYEQKEVA